MKEQLLTANVFIGLRATDRVLCAPLLLLLNEKSCVKVSEITCERETKR